MPTTDAQTAIEKLIQALYEAHTRTVELARDLTDEQMLGPRLGIVNPLQWEIGHVAFFQDFWVAQHFRGLEPMMPGDHKLYDSARIAHDTRWDLPLPTKAETLAYKQRVLDRIADAKAHSASKTAPSNGAYDEAYFLTLALMHEYMHDEAFTYTRQTHAWPAPRFSLPESQRAAAHRASAATSSRPLGDAEIPGGKFVLGSTPEWPFVFDNEQWGHEVEVEPFAISRTQVTQSEFAAFVDDGGYTRREFWSDAGWAWREGARAEHPVYWRREAPGRWLRRVFDRWMALEENLPVLHVNWYEAEAYCRWARRRLPTEAEWEVAASAEPASGGRSLSPQKRRFPWGDEPPTPERANLDWLSMGTVDVRALPAGESAFGCRQMLGNTWEWTATDFGPYPGFAPGPYKEYSEPWFGTHKVLRGGCWATRSGLIRNTYRNFYTPDRRDVWCGFRTCTLRSGS